MKYCVVVITELAKSENNYVDQFKLFENLESANEYGLKCCESLWAYPASAEYYVYKLMEDWKEFSYEKD